MKRRSNWCRLTLHTTIVYAVACGDHAEEADVSARQAQPAPLVSCAISSTSSDSGFVIPELACVAALDQGEAYAVFAYTNISSSTVLVAAGDFNQLTPSSAGPPPTVFPPNRHDYFVVPMLEQGELAWHFGRASIAPSPNSPPCQLSQTSSGTVANVNGTSVSLRRPSEVGTGGEGGIVTTEVIPGTSQPGQHRDSSPSRPMALQRTASTSPFLRDATASSLLADRARSDRHRRRYGLVDRSAPR